MWVLHPASLGAPGERRCERGKHADRSIAGPVERFAAVGPGKNGMVRPILLAGGEIVGTWRQSTALGRHTEHPTVELLTDVPEADVVAALDRYAAFVTG